MSHYPHPRELEYEFYNDWPSDDPDWQPRRRSIKTYLPGDPDDDSPDQEEDPELPTKDQRIIDLADRADFLRREEQENQ